MKCFFVQNMTLDICSYQYFFPEKEKGVGKNCTFTLYVTHKCLFVRPKFTYCMRSRNVNNKRNPLNNLQSIYLEYFNNCNNISYSFIVVCFVFYCALGEENKPFCYQLLSNRLSLNKVQFKCLSSLRITFIILLS